MQSFLLKPGTPDPGIFSECRVWGKIPITLFLLLLWNITNAQTIRVTGKVINEAGGAVINASVTANGAASGVATSDSGQFEISVAGNATLTVSSVGYKTRENRC